MTGWVKRLVAAGVVVALLVAIPPSTKMVQEWDQFGIAREAPRMIAKSFAGEESVEEALQRYLSPSAQAGAGWSEFESELFPIVNRRALYATSDANLISFQMSESPRDAFGLLAACLEQNGWLGLTGSDQTMGTFVKESGVFRWAYVSCGCISGETVAVLQVERAVSQ